MELISSPCLTSLNAMHWLCFSSMCMGTDLMSPEYLDRNELNAIAALVLVHGTDFLSLFDQPQRDALAMLFLNVHGYGFDVAGIFWGLWLFPLGLLVYRSGFLPRILGVALIVNCFAFLIGSLTSLVLPHYEALVHGWMRPFHFGEQAFMLWLLIMGAKPKPLASPAYCTTPS